MVHKDVWSAAGMTEMGSGFLCIDCLEARIGHRLKPENFTTAPVNDENPWQTARLRDRLGYAQ